MKPVQHAIINYLSTGGWKPTRMIHNYIASEGFNISRKRLLRTLNRKARCGGIDQVYETKQKIWMYPR